MRSLHRRDAEYPALIRDARRNLRLLEQMAAGAIVIEIDPSTERRASVYDARPADCEPAEQIFIKPRAGR